MPTLRTFRHGFTRRGLHFGVLALILMISIATPVYATRLFALVNTGEIFVSTDQGVNWTIQSTVAVYDAVALQARLSGNDLFMAGASGSIYHSTDSGVNWNSVGARPWPNPARGGSAMSLQFTLSDPEVVTLPFVDAAGRLVAERPAAAFGEGTHTVVWGQGLPRSGVYFVRVETARGVIAARRWVVVG